MRYFTKTGMTVVAMLSFLPLAILSSCSKQEPNNGMEDVGYIDQEAEQSPTYHFIAGEVAIDRGLYHEALPHYVWLAQHMTDPVFAARATSVALELENYQAAAEISQLWAHKVPADLQTQAIAASLTLRTVCLECAKPYLSALLLPSDTETMQYLMQVYSTLDDPTLQQRYIAVLQTLGNEKRDTRALFVVADLQYDMGDQNAANKTLDSILEIKPNWIRANALRIQLLYEKGQKKEAFAYLNSVLGKDPNNAALKWLAAKMAFEMGEQNKGLTMLKSISNDKTYGDDARIELVKQYIQMDDFTQAQTYLRAYQAKNPNSNEGFFLSGFIAQETGKYDQAVQFYSRVKDGAYVVNARVQMALCQTKLGQAKTALNDIDRLAKEFPDESERIALVRAQILLDSNQYSAAYAALTQIINSSTDANVELHYVRSLVAIELNELQSAVTDLKFVISNNPKHIQAINMMTETLIAEGKLDEAKHYNDQASAISPNNPEVLNNTGWIKFRSGDVKASIPYLAKSYQATNNPDYAARLGEALWAQGQQSEAVNVWNRGLEIAPENEMLLNAMRSHLVRPAAR